LVPRTGTISKDTLVVFDRPSLGRTIRNRRRELGLSQEAFAERVCSLGVYIRQTEISRIELDKVLLPNQERLVAIAHALNMSLGDLLSLAGWDLADAFFEPGAERDKEHP
jgi:transcriptional regulator with XRE-family HTH domain